MLPDFLRRTIGRSARVALLAVGVGLAGQARAQCPVAANCTPANGQFAGQGLGFGITRVSLGTLNNATPADNIYTNYACTQGTVLTLGTAYTLRVETGTVLAHNVRVWIDYDNNGILNPSTEQVLLSNNTTTHLVANFRAPVTAVLNTPLRMRVSADESSSPNPAPCSTPLLGEVEDYAVTVVANTAPPQADFTAGADTITCSGLVALQDLSQGSPTTWSWAFGDGQTSTQQNPQHQYAAPGTYSVTLTVTNAQGTNTRTKANYIRFDNRLPVAASCAPTTTAFCCGAGIVRVQFGNALDFTSANASAGYQDFTCQGRAEVVPGNFYPLRVTTGGALGHDVRAWLDANGDGQFSATEQVFVALGQPGGGTATGQVLIPATLPVGAALRLRVSADAGGTTFGPCTALAVGQAEDYTALVVANTAAPVAAFGVDARTACDTVVQFRDSSQFAPTAWLWYFGDGQTSTVQNPQHLYTQTGLYTVALVTTNAFGSDSTTRQLAVTTPCVVYCEPTNLQTQSVWISQVQFAGINNSTQLSPSGYGSYLNQIATVTQGQPQTLTLNLTVAGGMGPPQVSFGVWIDYNQNGVWEATERVAQGASNGQNPVNRTFTIPGSARLGATRMRVLATRNQQFAQAPCPPDGAPGVEVEDYTVVIVPQQAAPVADFSADPRVTCSGLVQFTDLSSNAPGSWQWSFGDGQTATTQNPQYQYDPAVAASYTVKLVVRNAFGADSVTRTAYVRVTGVGAPQDPTCRPISTQPGFGLGIASVQLNTLLNNSGNTNEGYRDYSCTQRTTLVKGQTYRITVNNIQSNGAKVRAWIDYNNDAEFDTTTEQILASDMGGNHIASFTVPLTAVQGQPLRLRVGSDWIQRAAPQPCTPVQYGQFEDYTVVLDSALSRARPVAALAVQLVPNPAPAGGQVLVRFSGETGGPATGALPLTVRSVLGQVVHRQTLNLSAATPDAVLDLRSLPRGLYMITFEGPTPALRGTTRLVLD